MNLTLKKGLVGLLVLASHSASAAVFKDNISNDTTGFYVGGSVGMVGLIDRESTNQPIRDVHTLGAPGAEAGLLLGYDFYHRHRWGAGIEAFTNVTSISVADNQNFAPQTSYTVNMRYNWGLRLLPRYDLSPDTAAHLIVGYANGNFKIHDNGNYGIVSSTFSRSGLQLGLGVDTALCQRFLLRGDVLYTIYQAQTTYGTTTTAPPTTQTYENRPSTLEAVLSLVYKI